MLTKDRYKHGYQTAVYNENSNTWQVQTWLGDHWRGFTNVNKCDIEKEKKRQRELYLT